MDAERAGSKKRRHAAVAAVVSDDVTKTNNSVASADAAKRAKKKEKKAAKKSVKDISAGELPRSEGSAGDETDPMRTAEALAKKAKQEAKRARKAQKSAAPVSPPGKDGIGLQDPAPKKEGKKEAKKARKAAGGAAVACATDDLGRLVARVVGSFGSGGPSLSDLLNPDHPSYDATLKAAWKGGVGACLSKKQRVAVVAADLAAIASARDRGKAAAAALPFNAEPDDHCESPPEAYADLAPFLDAVGAALGRASRAELRIYDPYFCAGAVKQHLAALGFTSVRNDAVNFYDVLARGALPEHDVVVTNPPYSADHVERLLSFVGAHAKPYFLLMPNYVCQKPYFLSALNRGGRDSGGTRREPPVFVCPHKRYNYWTPKAMRTGDKVQSHSSALGTRTSPFLSFWYADAAPVLPRAKLLALGEVLARGGGCSGGGVARAPPLVCSTFADLPAAARST